MLIANGDQVSLEHNLDKGLITTVRGYLHETGMNSDWYEIFATIYMKLGRNASNRDEVRPV